MNIKKETFIILSVFVAFVGFGTAGIFTTDFVFGGQDVEMAINYCGIPSLILGAIFAYKGTFGYEKAIAWWRNLTGMIGLTLIGTMIFLVSFQGYILSINKVGPQNKVVLKGEIININKKENKDGSFNYSIDIVLTNSTDTVNLQTPNDNYKIGETITKELNKGLLGILYK